MATETLDFRVQNLDCEHDAHALERALANVNGIESLRVLPKAARVTLSFDPSVTSTAVLRQQLTDSGFPPRETTNATGRPSPFKNPKVVTSAVAGALVLVGWLVSVAEAEPSL